MVETRTKFSDTFLEGGVVFSPDGKHWACAVQNEGRAFVVRDGVECNRYDAVVGDSLAFSPDSRHLVYTAQSGEQQFVVFDEDEGQDYNLLYTTQGRGIVFLSNERIKYLTITPDGEFRLVQEEVMVY